MNEKGSRWHQSDAISVCQYLQTNAACGLSRKAARSRYKRQGRNSLFDDVRQGKNRYFRDLFLDPAILLMLFAAFLSAIFLSPWQTISILLLLILLIGVLVRGLRKCEGMTRITACYRMPTVRVVRDGKILITSAARVVVGDVLLLQTGDIVPGDCRLLTAQQLRVLTLQPDQNGTPIYKEYSKNAEAVYPYGSRMHAPEAENMLFGGSEILQGEAKAVLVAVGESSYLGAMRSFVLPTEIAERSKESPAQKLLKPYLHLWGILVFGFLSVMLLIGLFTNPCSGGLIEYFLILCILAGASSPTVFLLYWHWISVRGRLLCLENDPPKNRAVIKSEAGLQRLAGITDLFVVGKRGICDGTIHFCSAFVGGREIRANQEVSTGALESLCEAMWIRNEADTRVPVGNSSLPEESNTIFLTELMALCDFDQHAIQVRLRGVEKRVCKTNTVWKCVAAHLQEEVTNFYFDTGRSLLSRCILYEDGKRVRAITSQYRAALEQYAAYAEENGCQVLCVAKESDGGTLVLIGVVALREQVSAVLPSVVEELAQSGIKTYFFLAEDEYARVSRLPEPYVYRSSVCPFLNSSLLQQYNTFIGFSKPDLAAQLTSMHKSGHRVAVLGGNAEDRCFLRAGILTLACDTVADIKCYQEDCITEATGQEKSHKASQTMRRHADIIIERADRFSGGVYAALQSVSHSREVDVRVRMLIQFCFYSQLARFMLLLLSVCTGIGLFTGVQMLLSGFVFEIAALYFLADVSISQSALRRTSVLNQAFLSQTLFSKASFVAIGVSSGIPAVVAVILTLTGVLSPQMTKTYLFTSLLLLQIAILSHLSYQAKIRWQLKKALHICGVIVVSVIFLILLSGAALPLGAIIGMGAWNPITVLLLPLAPLLYWILQVLFSFLHRTAK